MNIELLAPAGSYESMVAAYSAGADAVYIGGQRFGARAYADNLDQLQMERAIDYAHIQEKKLYLTVNTLLKEVELSKELYGYLEPFYKHGLDAVIVQDMGVLQMVRKCFSQLPIHASTQMTITGTGGAKLLEDLGVSRVVTPRELSLSEIAAIHTETSLEIESFVHGALCYCYSGQCLFSSFLGGRSGNRGRCAQPCRLPYSVYEGERQLNSRQEQYPLSPKDMCTIEILPQIINAGITSLKIEGRMKKPEYTAGVVSIYRKYLDLMQRSGEEYQITKEDYQILLDLYNRDGFHKSYYQVRGGRDMMALHNEKKDVKGNDITKARNEKLFTRIRQEYLEKDQRLPIQGNIRVVKNQPTELTLTFGQTAVKAGSEIATEARKQPLTAERIRAQIMKTGNTPFYFSDLHVDSEDDVFLPIQVLNEIRREALMALEEKLIGQYRRGDSSLISLEAAHINASLEATSIDIRKDHPDENRAQSNADSTALRLTALAMTREQLSILQEAAGISAIYANCSIFIGSAFENDVSAWIKQMQKAEKQAYLSLPYIVRENELDTVLGSFKNLIERGLSGFLIHNVESFALLEKQSLAPYIVLDYQFYTLNEQAREFWFNYPVQYDTISPELNYFEMKKRPNQSSEMILYGYAIMMVSAQCLKKNLDYCNRKNSILTLKDRYRKKFKVKCECDFCYNIIYNSIPHGLLKEAKEVMQLKCRSLRLSFSTESREQTGEIVRLFTGVYLYQQDLESKQMFTKGHFKRGIE